MNQLLLIFLIGSVILIGAIMVNSLANAIGISTWFGFIESIGKKGFVGAFKEQGFLSLLFLIVIYPMLLGLLAWFGFKYIN